MADHLLSEEYLRSKHIPIVILDPKWHQIFEQVSKPSYLVGKEARMNELLKRQGKLNTDLKEIRKLKKRLMDEILSISEALQANEGNKKLEKKLEENKRLIDECNEKTDAYEDELIEIPREMEQLNYSMMMDTIDLVYDRIEHNKQDIDKIGGWINQVRIELKKNLVRKQEREAQNARLYAALHDVYGAEIIDLFEAANEPLPEEEKGKKE